jgi:hypothetical protein
VSERGKLAPGDVLVLAMSATAVIAAAVLGMIARGGTNPLPTAAICPSRIVLGVHCPGCGLTRSFITLAGGDLRGAIALNPAGPPLFALLVLVVITRFAKRARPDARAWRYVDAALGAAIVVTLVTRAVLFYLN